MCVGIAQYELHTDKVEEDRKNQEETLFILPTKRIAELNPKSYHINLGKTAVILPQGNPEHPVLGTFGWFDHPKWSNRPFYCYNVRVEGSKSKGGNPNDEVDYHGEYKIKDNFLVKDLIRSNRCIIPVDFFLEQPELKTDKRKFLIQREDKQAFFLAGIYNELVDEETGEINYAFTILTTPQTKITAKVDHKRSPLVLENEHLDFYLNDDTTLEQLEALYLPPDSSGFIAYEVHNRIAKVKLPESFTNNDKRLIEPIGDVLTDVS